MPRGYPDWGVSSGNIGIISSDTAENAARLGSVYRFTRTGKVMCESDFLEDYDLWTIPISNSPAFDRYAFDGLFAPGCLRIKGTAIAISSYNISRTFTLIPSNTYGIEIGIKDIQQQHAEWFVRLTFILPTETQDYEIYISPQTHELRVFNAGGAVVKVADIPTHIAFNSGWLILKGIFDLVNKTYKRVKLNDEIVLEDYVNPRVTAGAQLNTYLSVTIGVAQKSVENLNFEYSHCIVTFDEESI